MIFTVSSKGIALIKESEGWRDKVYKDTGGRPTIGYGHLLVKGDIFKQITREQGEALLAKDVSKAEIIVHRHVDLSKTTQNQYDAFVSFAFNLGNNGFVNPKTRAPSKIVAFHNKGDYEAAAGQFEKWVHDNGKVVDGLVTRRKKEEALYRGNV